MARKKSKNTSNNSASGIQINKWVWVIAIAAFLYFAHTEGDLAGFVQTDQVVWQDEQTIEYDSKNFNPDKVKDLELPNSPDCEVVKHTYYSLCYAEPYEQAAWVAYRLTYEETTGNADRKDDNFKPDDKVETGSALPNDYSASGYDRGHLAPAADFVFSESALAETFYMSNMSPQAPDFNRGIWKKLEEQVRTWIRKEKTLYIVSGGVLKKGLKKIGKRNKVSVPDYYYKIILDLKSPQIKAIAFLMKNEGSDEPLESFVVSIDEIEKETGIDFFPKLPDELEKELEASNNYSKWFKSK
jgi:endonuclease G, mitochondrial